MLRFLGFFMTFQGVANLYEPLTNTDQISHSKPFSSAIGKSNTFYLKREFLFQTLVNKIILLNLKSEIRLILKFKLAKTTKITTNI